MKMKDKTIKLYNEDLKEVKLGYSDHNHILLVYGEKNSPPKCEMLVLDDDIEYVAELAIFKYGYVISRARNYFHERPLSGKHRPLTEYKKIFDGKNCDYGCIHNSEKLMLYIPGAFEIYQLSEQEIIIKLLECDDVITYFDEEEDK